MNKKVMINIFTLVAVFMLSGCATTATDPWESWNREVQSFNDGLDDYALKPVAEGYRAVIPDFLDIAISNAFSNIDDISVFINSSLQGKFKQSGKGAARFLVNSTAGIGGLIDVATKLDLAKDNEDFGQTLGYWGVPSGPYLVLPLLGPSSPRGIVGLIGDTAMNPISYIGSSAVSGGLFVLNGVDTRADNLETGAIAEEAAGFGRYEFFRDAYLNQRAALIHDDQVQELEDAEEFLGDDFE